MTGSTSGGYPGRQGTTKPPLFEAPQDRSNSNVDPEVINAFHKMRSCKSSSTERGQGKSATLQPQMVSAMNSVKRASMSMIVRGGGTLRTEDRAVDQTQKIRWRRTSTGPESAEEGDMDAIADATVAVAVATAAAVAMVVAMAAVMVVAMAAAATAVAAEEEDTVVTEHTAEATVVAGGGDGAYGGGAVEEVITKEAMGDNGAMAAMADIGNPTIKVVIMVLYTARHRIKDKARATSKVAMTAGTKRRTEKKKKKRSF